LTVPLEGTIVQQHPTSLLEDGPGPGLELSAASFSRHSQPFIRAEVPTFIRITFYCRVKALA
jgi:hypothetical protein